MPGRPLRPHELLHHIRTVCAPASTHGKHVHRLGVCVSGGPDSMALAYLLHKLQQDQALPLQLFAWIVDHKARSDSTDEARKVDRNLADIGIESEILTMQWPTGVNPLHLSNFESQARTKRYELLARAATENSVRHLFLGHHKDDQVETVLMRLIRNQNTSLKGLAGMASSTPIPAAFDVFGVHAGPNSTPFPARSYFSVRERSPQQAFSKFEGVPFHVAMPNSISLERPLLAYRKQDLVATCEVNDIPYVVDPTNKDPESSLRNAVRFLRANYKLPRALDADCILRIQYKAQQGIEDIEKTNEATGSNSKVTLLDLKSGVAKVQIPFTDGVADARANVYTLSKLIEMVTPHVRVNQDVQISPRVLSHFTDIVAWSQHQAAARGHAESFSLAKVQFKLDDARTRSWLLSRQPMRDAEVEVNTRRFTSGKDCDLSPTRTSDFMLWDNRFWIQAQVDGTCEMQDVVVRPLQPDDMRSIVSPATTCISRDRTNHTMLLNKIRESAPGKIKFTIPVLTIRQRLVALPTFSYKFHNVLEDLKVQKFDWNVMYNAFSLMKKPPT